MATLTLEDMRRIIEIALDGEVAYLESNADIYEELGMDSVGAVAMIVEIQRRCRVRIPEEEVPNLRTPTLLLHYVNTTADDAPQRESVP